MSEFTYEWGMRCPELSMWFKLHNDENANFERAFKRRSNTSIHVKMQGQHLGKSLDGMFNVENMEWQSDDANALKCAVKYFPSLGVCNLSSLKLSWHDGHRINDYIDDQNMHIIRAIYELGYERTSIHTEDFRYIIERRPTIELQQINAETRTTRLIHQIGSKPTLRVVINPLSVVDSDEHPSHFKCPIKMSTMKEPVVAADGYTYETSAIEQWFAHKLTSPLNGESLTSSSLIPNYNLRSQIQE